MKAAWSKLPNLMNLPLKFPAPLPLVCVCRMHCTIQYYLSIHWSVPIESSIPAYMYVYVHIWPKPASTWPYDLLVSLLPHVAWYLPTLVHVCCLYATILKITKTCMVLLPFMSNLPTCLIVHFPWKEFSADQQAWDVLPHTTCCVAMYGAVVHGVFVMFRCLTSCS